MPLDHSKKSVSDISRVNYRKSAEISDNPSYKRLLSLCENLFLDPVNERNVIEAYLNSNNTYFSTIYVFNAKREIFSIFVHIDTKATNEEVADFISVIFRPDLVDKDKTAQMVGLGFQPKFWELLVSGFKEAMEGCFVGYDTLDYWLPPKRFIIETSLPAGYSCKSLKKEHAQHIANRWMKDLGSHLSYQNVEIVLQNIKFRPNAGIFYGDEDTLVAWMLTYDDGEFGMLHVTDGHRRKGIAKFLIKVMFEKTVESCGNGFAISIHKTNKTSSGLFSQLGWVKQEKPWQMFVHK